MRDGAIISDEGIASLRRTRFDAVVTSFYGVTYDRGFSSDHTRDKNEKLMNLRPDNCSTIYVVLSWEKLGTEDQVVATVQEGIDPQKKYFIITDPPQGWERIQPDKVREIAKWSDLREKGIVEFIFAHA